MNDEQPRKWKRLKEFLHENSGVLSWVSGIVAFLTFALVSIQTYQGEMAIGYRAEQQQPRLSLRIQLEQIENPVGFRIVAPLEIGGTTVARRVTLKNYVTSGQPKQHDYISSINVDWNKREGHMLGDVSPTEVGRRFVANPLSHKQIETILSADESLYFVARLEYCDIQDDCYYFMRCAELGNKSVDVLTYCGTRLGP